MNSPGPVISAEQLAIWLGFIGSAEMKPSSVVVVDCRFSLAEPDLGRSQYAAGHIPSAFYLDLNRDLSHAAPPGTLGGRHPLPDLEVFAVKLQSLGIGPKTWLVAYDDSHFAFSARLWWMLRYLGHERVAVLDGGWKEWVSRAYPVSEEDPTPSQAAIPPQARPQPNQLNIRQNSSWVVDRKAVKKLSFELTNAAALAAEGSPSSSKAVLIDSRSPARYRGEEEPIDPIAGHIPGAQNCFWKEVTDERGMAHSWPEQRTRWQSVTDSGPAEIWVYCGSGVTACVNLLSLELAGFNNSKLYIGSWSDWCAAGEAISGAP